MTVDNRRRFGAIAALILGLFIGISLLPDPPTGPVGRLLGGFLSTTLGAGALGLPLLGFGIAAAGFNRLPILDMKRVAILVTGLCLLVPYFIGVFSRITPDAFDSAAGIPSWGARMAGVVPGFLAWAALQGDFAGSNPTVHLFRTRPQRRAQPAFAGQHRRDAALRGLGQQAQGTVQAGLATAVVAGHHIQLLQRQYESVQRTIVGDGQGLQHGRRPGNQGVMLPGSDRRSCDAM